MQLLLPPKYLTDLKLQVVIFTSTQESLQSVSKYYYYVIYVPKEHCYLTAFPNDDRCFNSYYLNNNNYSNC